MVEGNNNGGNKNKQIWMKFGSRKFSRSPLLTLEMRIYRKILIW